MKKRAVVLIDGENFRYSLMALFPSKFRYLPKKVDWPRIFTLPLAEDHELVRIYWYVVESLHFRPFEIPETDYELEKILKKVVTTKLELKRNGAQKETYLAEKRCHLKELRSSIDLLAFREISDLAILFSGDQDYVPAIQAYKDSGKHIFSVNFETANGRILPGGSYALSGLVDRVVTLKQEQLSGLIREF